MKGQEEDGQCRHLIDVATTTNIFKSLHYKEERELEIDRPKLTWKAGQKELLVHNYAKPYEYLY